MFTAGRIMRSAQRPNAQRPSSSPSVDLPQHQSSIEAPEKIHLYNLPSANYHVYRQQQLELEKERRSTQETESEQQKQFYVPFIWQALVATIVGLVVICIGITLCVLGYEAENRQTSRKQILESRPSNHPVNKTRQQPGDEVITNSPNVVLSDNSSIVLSINCTHDCRKTSKSTTTTTTTTTASDLTDDASWHDSRLKFLIYLGPVIMSCGSFAIVFSCVVVCETRDRVLQLLEKRRRQLEAMATGHNRQELLANIEENLLSSNMSLASLNDEDHEAADNNFQSNIDREATLQPSTSAEGEPPGESHQPRPERPSSHHPKLKIDVFTKSLIRSQLRNKLTALVDIKLET